MYRQQISVVILLVASMGLSAYAADPMASNDGMSPVQGRGLGSTFTGRLIHNSSDQNGLAPYVLLDGWGVVRGYVTPGAGMELEPYLNRQVSLQGTVSMLPGGNMPRLTAERIVSGSKPARTGGHRGVSTPASRNPPAAPARTPSTSVRPVTTQSDGWMPIGHGSQSPVQAAAYQEVIKTPAEKSPLTPVPTDSALPSEPSMEAPQGSLAPRARGFEPTVESFAADCGRSCGNCGNCGECDECEAPCYGYPCRPSWCGPSGIYAKTDFLLGWMRGMHVPALATTGPTAQFPGVLGDPPGMVSVLFGDTTIHDQVRAGGRLQVGVWLDECQNYGIEGEYLALEEASTHFRMWSDGNPIVSRPFIDDATGDETIQRVAFPRGYDGSLDGAINIDAVTRFQSAGARLRFAICREDINWTDGCGANVAVRDSYRTQLLVGYRFLRLDDRLNITEQLTSTDPNIGAGAVLLQDNFSTTNQFHGGEVGMQFEMRRNRWVIDLLPKIALGNNHEIVNVSGLTQTTAPVTGARSYEPAGLLATSTNSGIHVRDQFAVVPELSLEVGYQVTRHTRATFGYTFIYWSQVARAGDQIDRRVPIPGETTSTGHPTVPFETTGFWAQAMNFGLDFRW